MAFGLLCPRYSVSQIISIGSIITKWTLEAFIYCVCHSRRVFKHVDCGTSILKDLSSTECILFTNFLPYVNCLHLPLCVIVGGVGVLWFVAWMFIAYDSPAVHPRVSSIEREYIQESLQGHMSKTTDRKVGRFSMSFQCYNISCYSKWCSNKQHFCLGKG